MYSFFDSLCHLVNAFNGRFVDAASSLSNQLPRPSLQILLPLHILLINEATINTLTYIFVRNKRMMMRESKNI